MYRYSVPKLVIYAEWRDYGQPIISELFDCHMVSRHESCLSFDCDEFIRRAYFKIPARFCFVFDALQLHKGHLFFACPYPWLYELRLMVTWNSSYMLSFMGSHTLPVFVHRAGTNPPTPIEAISMFPDMLVEVTVIQQTIKRLPRPFRTNCQRYEEGDFRPAWGGHLTFSGCVQECKMAIEQEICNCTMPTNEYSGTYIGRLCDFKNFKGCENAAIENRTMVTCERRCQLGCKDVLYDVRLAGLQRFRQSAKNIHKSSLVLSMASSTVETFTYNQAIELEMTFGYISSYIGVWTGLSFIGIAEKIFSRLAALYRVD
ncbi:uncharacterized protein LOC111266600 isoform X2 [Varroa jacobsoni]|nr:uncharacterized protein LOC111266600 isoform X2 [Varroa jacobsoni]